MNQLKIELNCDMGESYGRYRIGNDAAIMPYINSCNLACGYHAGDPLTIQKTIDLAIQHQVKIGAHPSYPDLSGFGRRSMQIPQEELTAMLLYQIGALKSMVELQGAALTYVKPHGALYNDAYQNKAVANAIFRAVQAFDLPLMGLAASPIQQWATAANIPFIAEGFADRRYTQEGFLQARSTPGAVLQHPDEVAEQVLAFAMEQAIQTANNKSIVIPVQSICIHGDNPAALDILKCIHHIFNAKNLFFKTNK